MKRWTTGALACLALFLGACDDAGDPVRPTPPDLEFALAFEPATLAHGETVTVTLAVTNHSAVDVDFGRGSSSCALTVMVEVGDGYHPALSERTCTADMADRVLRAGETWTESWSWSGDVHVDGLRVALEPGTYQVKGASAYHAGSPRPFTVDDPLPLADRVSLWLSVDPVLIHPDRPATVAVSATNASASPALIGHGSCVFAATVAHDGREHLMVTDRACLADATPRYLAPGETRTETWGWDGRVVHAVTGNEFALPPGKYPVTGRAGELASRTFQVEVTDEPADPPRLALTIASEPAALTLGGSVQMTATATNIGTVPVTLHSGDSCLLGGLVYNGRIVHDMIEERICLMSPITVTLEPGESASGAWLWSGDVWHLGERTTLAPGTYEIAATTNGYIGEPVEFEIVE